MKYLLLLLVLILAFSCQTNTSKQVDQNSTSAPEATSLRHQTDTLLNTQDYLILGNTSNEVEVIKANQMRDYSGFEVLAEYEDDLIIGKAVSRDQLSLFRKFNPTTTFKDYSVEVYQGALAEPDFSTAPDAKAFESRIKDACNNGINFAGHYTLVIWGCGAPCQTGVVVNRKTGEIIEGYQTSLGSDFRKDSKLIIMNSAAIDPNTNLIEICSYCTVSEEVWTGKGFEGL
ncbi:hypothetical protein [Roseivirga pacifica]|uniref:hypothetical protein n=1 Tax=Roseivirga pacifica TaxID=1267423 RepID=UPI00227BFD46|nr:hypothetical protein [Roseivirga pacifica]